MWAFARLMAPNRRVYTLGPGDIIGRMPNAALRVNDPRVSEAHALVSLRGTALKLLALRGRFLVDNAPQTEVILRDGLVIELAHHLPLEVIEVSVPEFVLGLEGPGLPRQVLPSVCALRADGPALLPSFVPDADAMLWFDGHEFRIRLPGEGHEWSGPDRALAVGDVLTVGEIDFHVVPIALERVGSPVTARDPLLDGPLSLVLRYDTVHVQRGQDALTIDGVPALIVTELGLIGKPVEWRTVAREIWPEEDEDQALRQKWDRGLARLRQRLGEAGLRRDLVRLVGAGRVELYLHQGDHVEDAT